MATSDERRKLTIRELLRPHTGALALGLAAVIGEAAANLAEPWPLKIVLDTVSKAKPGHGWLNHRILAIAGTDKLAILKFAAIAVLAIAAFGAICSYTEKYLTTTVGQWVMHDLRQTLYSHMQRLSLAYHDRKETGDLISRVTSDIDAIQSFIASGLLGVLDQQPDAGGHGGRHVLPELALHPDRGLGGAGPCPSSSIITRAASRRPRARCGGRKARWSP